MTKLEQIKEIEQIFDDLDQDEITMSDMEVLDVPIINHKTGEYIDILKKEGVVAVSDSSEQCITYHNLTTKIVDELYQNLKNYQTFLNEIYIDEN
jgi:hypothetical protein